MSLREKFFALSSAVLGMAMIFAGAAGADSNTPLAQKMRTMSDAVKGISHPGTPPASATPMDDLKRLKDAAIDCRDHSNDLAPAEVAADPEALQGFHAEFVLLVTKIGALEQAMLLPADAPNRDAQIKAALADILAVKKDGHSKYNNN